MDLAVSLKKTPGCQNFDPENAFMNSESEMLPAWTEL
ncbi:MAG: hypothetical protein ACI92B_002479 [Marinobacter maritimus]|jgi:hypothetical protein|tara:strand:- start:6 stop:116 length:111 start_codon:yes stop_codon:yes gene_type:complete